MQVAINQVLPRTAYDTLATDLAPEFLLPPQPELRIQRAHGVSALLEWLASSPEWAVLYAAATVFLSHLAKNAADDVWKNKSRIASALLEPASALLAKTVRALCRVGSATSETHIVIGIDYPDAVWGIGLVLPIEDQERTAWCVALFVASADVIRLAVEQEIELGRAPLGRVNVVLQDDGFFCLKWMDRENMHVHNRSIPRVVFETDDATDT